MESRAEKRDKVMRDLKADRMKRRKESLMWFQHFTRFFDESIQDFHPLEPKQILVYVPFRIQAMIQNEMMNHETLGHPDGSGFCANGLMHAQYKGAQMYFKDVRILTGYEEAFIMVAPYYTYGNAFLKRKPLTDF